MELEWVVEGESGSLSRRVSVLKACKWVGFACGSTAPMRWVWSGSITCPSLVMPSVQREERSCVTLPAVMPLGLVGEKVGRSSRSLRKSMVVWVPLKRCWPSLLMCRPVWEIRVSCLTLVAILAAVSQPVGDWKQGCSLRV